MKVTECSVIANMTFFGVDGKLPPDRKSVAFDGESHQLLIAYDIGERVVIRGEFDLLGKDVSFS